MVSAIGFFHFGTKHDDPMGSLISAMAEARGTLLPDSLIVLPEAFNIGRLYTQSEPLPDLPAAILKDLKAEAARYRVGFVAGLILDLDDGIKPPFSSAYLIDRTLDEPVCMCHKKEEDGTSNYTPCPKECDIRNPAECRGTSIVSLICLDIQDSSRVSPLLGRSVPAPQIVCVPAHMSSAFFGDSVCGTRGQNRRWDGKYLALANSRPDGCPSFIRDPTGRTVRTHSGAQNRIKLLPLSEASRSES
jgi:hypothetical protein